jgi:putative spermidine/putrescine transport system ATP-binding protein
MGYSTESKMLAWRPGGVVVGDGPHKARVLASSFAGGHREYVLESQLGPIKADAPIESAEVALGDPVVFDLPQATARPLAP